MKISKQVVFFVILETVLFFLSICVAFLLRFDFDVPQAYIELALSYWLYFIGCVFIKIVANYFSGLYRGILDSVGIDMLTKVLVSVIISNIICVMPIFFFHMGIPRSIPLLTTIIDTAFLLSSRFLGVIVKISIKNLYINKNHRINTLIVGGGSAGAIIVKELKSNININHYPVGIIDDNPMKTGKSIYGIRILGDRNDISKIVNKFDVHEIVITIPSARKKDIRDIIDICSNLDVKIKTLPSVKDLINSEVQYSLARDIDLEDLLGRTEMNLNNVAISKIIKDKSVLVTGAGGSIGSEIVRTVVKYSPRNITLLDFYESGVYELSIYLKFQYPELNINIAVCNIQEYDLLEEVFISKNPNVVFHAAAHKHVPLMEEYPKQAIRNNIIGSFNIADLSNKYEVERFVMISTDKAVNPTNIMGATKQFAEKIVNSYSKNSNTLFSVVRFGNVLGSNGSVVPIFKRQIDHGGPVTVTHKEIVRYFMTVPEAVSLVIEAVSMSVGGETFVLDMGEPVKLYELAQKMIRFYGYTPNKDIQIEITGLRPGEKLHEELLMQDETLKSTHNKSVFISDQKIIDHKVILERLKEVRELAANGTHSQINFFLKENIEGYLS